MDGIPATYLGPSEFDNDYMKVSSLLARTGLATDYSYVLYERGQRVTAASSAQVLATLVHPYFNRTWNAYCSHRQTPPDPATDKGEPLAIRAGRVIYIANPLFRAYRKHGYRAYKQLIAGCLNLLLPEPMLVSNMPSTAELTLLEQGSRQIVHMLHYVPQRRAAVDIVEDVIPLYEVEISVRAPKAATHESDGSNGLPGDANAELDASPACAERHGPKRVYLVPGGEEPRFYGIRPMCGSPCQRWRGIRWRRLSGDPKAAGRHSSSPGRRIWPAICSIKPTLKHTKMASK